MTTTDDMSTLVTPEIDPFITEPPPPPPDIQPFVTISVPSRIVATIQTQLTVTADRGTHWVWSFVNNRYEAHPIVSYSQTEVDFDNVSIRDHTGGGGVYAAT